MEGPTLKSLPVFNTIGHQERKNVLQSLKRPLSGYLGGRAYGGYWTTKLEEDWTNLFACNYAIPCNSATSGLLAGCMAADIGRGDTVWTTPYSMSATAACAMVLGADVKFIDIEPLRYSINLNMMDAALVSGRKPKAVIVTNLFGHPAYLHAMRIWCDANHVIMIEDNAQSIFAMENGKYAGTIGHIGVFSLNVHKHLQVGEGGIITTGDSELSSRLRGAINHGELQGDHSHIVGLNLRMTEPTAAMACAQLAKGGEIIRGRRRLAHALTAMMKPVKWLKPPIEDIECRHSYYVWAGRAETEDRSKRRRFVHELSIRGFPLRVGYSPLLPKVFHYGHLHEDFGCPVADRIEQQEIITFEICAHDPKAHHLQRMQEIVEYVNDSMERVGEWKSQVAKSAGKNLPM